MTPAIPNADELKKRILFVPLETKEALHSWIKVFLGLDIPDCIVDEASTSNPMQAIWDTYERALKNDDPTYNFVLNYAARDTFKTISASILEVLMLCHLGRSVAHMAAIEAQAKKSQEYVKKFLRQSMLREFVVGDNQRKVEICRYYDDSTGISLSPREYNSLTTPAERSRYRQISNYIVIVICTMAGANCVDPESLVWMADGTRKRMHQLGAGEDVLVFDAMERKTVSMPVKAVGGVVKNSMRLTFDDGDFLVLSEDHKLLTNNGWLCARKMRLGYKVPGLKAPQDGLNYKESISLGCIHGNFKSMLVGTLLGDASLIWPVYKPTGKRVGAGPLLSISHGRKQHEYLQHKMRVAVAGGYGMRSKIGACEVLKSWTHGQADFEPLWRMFYESGRKRVTREILDLVDEEALAYWLMDDGSGNAQVVGTCKDRKIQIHTCSFTREEHELMVSWFKERWGLKARIGVNRNSKGARYDIIEFSLEESRKLSKLVDKFIHPSMKYKFPAPEKFLDVDCIHCGVPLGRGRMGRLAVRCALHRRQSIREKLGTGFFTKSITKIEFVGPRYLSDLSIDTDKPHLKNVILNSSIISHNSEHSSCLVVDEVDVVANPKAYEEARAIPAPYEGKHPITLLTSTRKFSFGLVQKEIDRAKESGLIIKHWNVIDVTAACPATRHLPDQPKIPIYRSDDTLRALSEDQYNDLAEEQQEKYVRDEGYEGCLKNCKLFAACKGRLATHQKSTSSLLKPIEHTQSLFRKFSPEMAKAQLLCWKPSSEGMIYPRFDRAVHMLTPAQIAEKVTGEHYDPKMTKTQLIALLKTREVQWHAGMDWGYTHNFATVIGARDGARMFIIDVISQPELELGQKLELCETRLKPYQAQIWPDPAYPSDIKTFKRNGYRMRDWDKGKGTVAGGIEVVRLKLWPSLGQPELFFLAGDEGVELLVKRMQAYHYIIDPAGRITEEPDDEDDDECDALRYLVMNVFAPKGKGPIASKPEERNPLAIPAQQQTPSQVQQQHWNQIMGHVGMSVQTLDPVTGEVVEDVPKVKGKKGGLIFDLG
jgi:hypothetical protein